jgi:GTP:adenosylcobinamide-phosphate guanylyltransferase
MIGRKDDRRKEDAEKKAELELKKKKEEAVREVCVAKTRPPVGVVPADMPLQAPDAIVHVLPAQYRLSSCEYALMSLWKKDANLEFV